MPQSDSPPGKKRRQERHLAWIIQLVAQAQAKGFYGSITIKMEDGLVRRTVKEESLVPPEESTQA